MSLWPEYHRNDVVFSSVQQIRKPVMLICPMSGNINVNHFVKTVPVKFLFFPFLINNYFCGEIYGVCQQPVPQ